MWVGSVFQYRTMSVNEHNSSINLAELSQKCINAVSHGIDHPLGHGEKNNKDPIGSMTDGSVTIFTTHLHLICRILVRILGKDCWVEKINLPSVCKHMCSWWSWLGGVGANASLLHPCSMI